MAERAYESLGSAASLTLPGRLRRVKIQQFIETFNIICGKFNASIQTHHIHFRSSIMRLKPSQRKVYVDLRSFYIVASSRVPISLA